jgi:phenol 2-monooxygenase
MFADRAENAELWDVEGRRFIDLSSFLLPAKGRYGLRDYEKMFCPDFKGGNDIFNMRGTDREHGCVVVVRPDQYVAHVLPLAAYAKLEAFFGDFMLSP